MRNPKASPAKVLGTTDAALSKARADVTAYLVALDDNQELPEADMRAAIAAPVSDAIWNTIKADLGLT